MSNAFVLSFPVLNNILTIELLCYNEKMYENTKEKLLEKGDIYIPTDEVPELNMDTESTTPSKKYSQDAFIANIQRDMEIVASLKYDGYESDLRKLCCLAESYISKKQTIKTTNPTDVLTNSDWFKPLIEIEAKFKNAPQLKEDQQDLKEALISMRELLLKESTQTIEPELSAIEDNGYQPTLRF